MVTYLPRSAWKARAARGSTALVPSEVLNEAFHWPGMSKAINAVGEAGKARVASALRGWQNYHMDVRGWSDIAYQAAIDQEGRVWTLRGINIRSGANGDATVNRKYGAVLLILGPGEKPSAAMVASAKAVVVDYRSRFPKVPVKPTTHSAVRPAGTDCPGDLARDMINSGQFNAGLPQPAKPPTGAPSVPSNSYYAHAHAKAAAGHLEQTMRNLGMTPPDHPAITGEGDEYFSHYWAKVADSLSVLVEAKTRPVAAAPKA